MSAFTENILASSSSQAGSPGSMVLMIVFYVAIFGLMMYFLAIKPQKKEEARKKALMDTLKVGSYVVTSAGFYGQVIGLEDDIAVVEFGNNKNCRIAMKKSHIVSIENESEE